MADNSAIEWTDATWNPIVGCSVISPGCKHCYAMKLAGGRMQNHPSRQGLTRATKEGPVWTGEVRFIEQWLDQPLRWAKPRMIFVCAHADLFHENVPDEWIDRVFAVMALAPWHTFQVLTKRADRMARYFGKGQGRGGIADFTDAERRIEVAADRMAGRGGAVRVGILPLPNVWLGVSAEDQQRADERIPHLLATPAAVRWVSAEPLLGPVDLMKRAWRDCHIEEYGGAGSELVPMIRGLNWIVAGGESGPGARPMHPDWARSLRDQCAKAGVDFHFKQWGEWIEEEQALNAVGDDDHRIRSGDRLVADDAIFVRLGKKAAGRLLDGYEHNGMPPLPARLGKAGAVS